MSSSPRCVPSRLQPLDRPRSTEERGESDGALAALVLRARTGDERAFAALYRRCAPLVHGVLLASVAPEDAQDLVQEVFLEAWRTLAALREPEALGPWLATMARHRAARHRARARPTVALTDEPLARERDDGRDPGRDEEPSDESARILAHLRTLPEAYRETLALRLIEGLSGPAIAAALGRSPGAVRVNLTRGMRLLRAKLQRDGWS